MRKKNSSPLLFFPKKFSLKKLLGFLITALLALGLKFYDQVAYPIVLPDDGEPMVLYASQLHDDLRKMYQEAIESAQESIYLYIYSFTDRVVAEALNRKADDGIKVSVVCDKDSYAKIKLLLGRKIELIPRQQEKGLMHLKILIIDEKTVFLGSTNLTTESLNSFPNHMLSFYSPNLASYLLQAFDVLKQPDSFLGAQIPEKYLKIGGQQVEAWLLSGNPRASTRLVKLIDGAQKSINIAMYTFTRYDVVHALLRAQKRGVSIQVHLDSVAAKGSSQHIATLLYLQNIPLFVSRGKPLLHHKCMMIDDKTFVSGSANWTKNAFNDNDDCFLVIEPLFPDQLEKLQKFWKRVHEECQPYTSAYDVDAA